MAHLMRGLNMLKEDAPRFMQKLSSDPLGAIKAYPAVAIFSVIPALLVIILMYYLLADSSEKKKKEDEAKNEKDEVKEDDDDDKTVQNNEEAE